MESDKLTLIDASGTQIGEITLSSEEDGWFCGMLLSHQFSPQLKEALAGTMKSSRTRCSASWTRQSSPSRNLACVSALPRGSRER